MQSEFRKKAIELLDNNENYVRTGCTLLDCMAGGGVGLGFPFGKILNFVGDKSSGKTFISNEIIAANYHKFKKDLKFNYDDAETGYTFDTSKMYGVNIMHEDTLFSNTVEELDVNLYNFLKKIRTEKQKGIYVVDSLDGLANADTLAREEERAKEMKKCQDKGEEYSGDKGTYGMQSQKFLSQEFFRTKAAKLDNRNILLIFISQIRDKIDARAFQKKWTRAGGKALDFYAHSVVVLANVSKIKKDNKIIGLVVKAKTDKSKTPRPYRECEFSLYFDYGIDDIGSSLDYLFDLRGEDGKLKKASEEIRFDGNEEMTLKNLKEFFEKKEMLDVVREFAVEKTGSKKLTTDLLKEFAELNVKDDKDFKELFGTGETFTRDELIEKAEKDPKFKREIEIMTIAKWEEAESKVATNRKGKYA